MNETIWIATGIILLISAIVTWAAILAKRQADNAKQQLTAAMQQSAAAAGLIIDRTELFRNRIIGLSVRGRAVLYESQSHDKKQSVVVPLDEISHCEVVNQGSKRTFAEKNGKHKIEEHISEIVLNLYQQQQLKESLVFYNEIQDGSMELAENRSKAVQWKALIEAAKAPRIAAE